MGSDLEAPRIPRDFDGYVNCRVVDGAELTPERLREKCGLNSGAGSIALFCDFLIERLWGSSEAVFDKGLRGGVRVSGARRRAL